MWPLFNLAIKLHDNKVICKSNDNLQTVLATIKYFESKCDAYYMYRLQN